MEDRLTIALLVIASMVAALASTAQAYVSWQSRNDLVRATMSSQTAQRCAEASSASLGYVTAIQQYRVNRTDMDGALFYVIEKLSVLEMVWAGSAGVAAGETDAAISQYRKLNDQITSATDETRLDRFSADATALHAQLRSRCGRVLRAVSKED
jgi:hypothetical protein